MASINGLFFTEDRVAVTEGHAPSPNRPDEIVMSPLVAKQFGFHLGQVISYGLYSNAQQNLPGFGTSAVAPALRAHLKLVGLASLNSEIVQDDVDTLPTILPLSPAFAREVLARKGEQFSSALTFGIQTRGGAATVPAVDARSQRSFRLESSPRTTPWHRWSPRRIRSLKPISIALGVFGAVSLLAALLIAVQLMARRLRVESGDLRILRALGAGPSDTMLDGLIGLELSILVGSVLAAAVAVALSPLAPLGPVRSVDPSGGISFDWTVLGFGVVVLFVLLSVVAALLAYSTAPHRTALRPRIRSTSGARVVTFTARAGLSAPGVVGVRMALEPGEGRSAVPVRSALIGSVLAVALIVTTLTFGNSLQTLVSRPALYGWNWTYILQPVGAGNGDVPKVTFSLLQHDRYVAAYSGVSFNEIEIDGQGVPFLVANVNTPVVPPILSGRGVDGRERDRPRGGHDGTTAQARRPVRHRVLRRAGERPDLHPAHPADDRRDGDVPRHRLREHRLGSHVHGHRRPLRVPDGAQAFRGRHEQWPGSRAQRADPALVRIRSDAPPAAALASLQGIVAASNRAFASAPRRYSGRHARGAGRQRPAEIVNYKTIGLTPTYLVSGLALGAIVALALTLLASVRQRRHGPGPVENHRVGLAPSASCCEGSAILNFRD